MNGFQKNVLPFAAIIVAFAVVPDLSAQGMKDMMGMKNKMEMDTSKMSKGGMITPIEGPKVPPVLGYSNGQKILFIHTETSDPKIAKILTDMMGGSPVLVVPSLVKAPEEMLVPVYVFTNGHKGNGPMGPLGGQPDIFDNAPGDPKYSPLRTVILVTWKEEMTARTLKSVSELERVIKSDAVSTKKAGVVVNMPFLTWPGGKR
ncbi:MAG: hypothetical protein VB913_15080 [Rhodospirillales bacterium]|jgi:hypothetical protein